MPYSMRGNQPGCDGWAVINTATGKTITCHPTKKKALAHLRALYKSIGGTTMQDLALNVQFPDAPGGMMQIGASGTEDTDQQLDDIAAAANPDKNRGNAETLRRYWSEGEGAAKIRFGTPGDHERCVRQLIEHAKFTEDQAHGYCQLLEKRVTGLYTSQHAQLEKGKHAAAEAAPHLPALVTIPGVDILAAGTWQLSTGRQTFTRQDLEHAVEAAACPAVGSPLIKIGHLDPRFASAPDHDGEPAIGKVTNMRLAAGGMKITGDLAGMPGWLAGIAASAFPRRSVEGKYGFRCQIGHDHPFVVTALALLGVTPPGVGVLSGLDDIAALYGVQAASGEWHTEPTEEEGPVVAVTEEDVRRAYYAAGVPHTRWITELQMAPTQLIVADDADSKLYRVPFSIEAETVRFGDPEEIDSYAAVAASRGTGTIVAWASAEESRAVTAQGPGGGQHMMMPDLDPSWDDPTGLPDLSGLTIADLEAADTEGGQGTSAAASEEELAAAAKLGTGARFKKLTAELGAKGASDPAALAAWIGRKKYGKSKFASLAGKARKGKGKAAAAGDDQDLEAAAGHGPYTGEHAHPHTANGDQGGDATHDHMHAHDGDGVHAHAHDPVSAAPPAAPAASNLEEVRVDFTTEQLAAIRAKLGKNDGEEVTPAEIAAAFTDAPTVTASAGAIPKPNEELGVYLVEASVLHDWRKAAEAGERAATELRHSQREEVLAAAIRDGKIPQARLDHWRRAWEADEEYTRSQLEHLAKGFVPVGPAIGAAGLDPDLPGADFEEQMAYKKLFPEDVKAGRRG